MLKVNRLGITGIYCTCLNNKKTKECSSTKPLPSYDSIVGVSLDTQNVQVCQTFDVQQRHQVVQLHHK